MRGTLQIYSDKEYINFVSRREDFGVKLLNCCLLQFQIQTMLDKNICQKLQQLGIEATHPNQFTTGLKLMQLVLQVFYKGQNTQLSSKIRLGDHQKTGNSILNVNIILNHLKKDQSIVLDERIRQLTAFKVIEQEDEMTRLIQWILDQYQKPNQTAYLKQEMSPPRQQQNEFQNLYFVSSMQKKQQLDDSLEVENKEDKVVRKGSFKMLKPKISTEYKSSREQIMKIEHFHTETNLQDSRSREPLKQRIVIENNIESDRQELNCRNTIPKMYEKPPLYKPKHKEQRLTENRQKKESTPHITAECTDREAIMQHIQKLNKEIISEQKSLKMTSKEDIKIAQKSRKSERKIFKMEIPQVEDKKKKAIMQWLISINLLNSSAAKFMDNLHSICKDGVIFLQVANFFRGRGKQLFYFREPKKSAEIHSNYQKLFNALAQHPDFSSSLLSQFEYFVPEVQPKAFWSFLLSIYNCYNRRVQSREPGINRYQQSLQKKVQKASSKKKSQSEEISYNEIKYNSSSLNKQTKSAFSSVQLPRRETPKPNKSRKQSLQSEQSAVKMNGPYGLVQNQEPNQQVNRTERGYKEMYLCKFKNMETPQKNRSFINTSLSKSRIKALIESSKHSNKKKQVKPTIPSITLQMQMKVLKVLSSLQIQQQNQQLFKDPYRNGLLICQVIQKTYGIECFASRKPKSIQDCRNNFISAIEALKSQKKNFNSCYQQFIEDLVKGQRSLLYGLIWQAIQNSEKQNQKMTHSIDFTHNQKETSQEAAISWIRSVQTNYPQIGQYKIRNENALHFAIVNTDFLFHYSCFVTGKRAISPTYERPVNDIQKQSNLKKVLGYLVHNKIIRSNYLWKTKILVKREESLLKQLIQELINHYNHLHIKENLKSVNFVKYLKREDSGSKQKPIQRLETTANQTFSQHCVQTQVEQPKLEVPWMRKLGFNGNLQINNGVILCRLMAKLNMKTIERMNQHPQSRAQSLGNIRKAIKDIPKFKWDEYDILDCDQAKTLQVYAFIKDRYKHAYAMKGL